MILPKETTLITDYNGGTITNIVTGLLNGRRFIDIHLDDGSCITILMGDEE